MYKGLVDIFVSHTSFLQTSNIVSPTCVMFSVTNPNTKIMHTQYQSEWEEGDDNDDDGDLYQDQERDEDGDDDGDLYQDRVYGGDAALPGYHSVPL